jgi:nicotinate-nucleotide pyrophosphorylase (carboxylating)
MTDEIIKLAVEEDCGLGDITSENIFGPEDRASADFIAKDNMTLCGVYVAKSVFNYVDACVDFRILKKDGENIKKGSVIARASGRALSILKAERTALNFMQRMSAVATFTAKMAKIAGKHGVMLTDTRKSLPGMRKFDKYAVRTGGARNHRMSLSDCALIKDNHIAAAGGITKAVNTLKSKIGHTSKIEVETKNLKEVLEAVKAGADIIMLDNMSAGEVKQAKKFINGRAIIEVSGGVNAANLEDYCKAGPDVISMGALTHSASAKDISLLFKQKGRNL